MTIKSWMLNPVVSEKKRNSLKLSVVRVIVFCNWVAYERTNKEGFNVDIAPIDPKLETAVDAAYATVEVVYVPLIWFKAAFAEDSYKQEDEHPSPFKELPSSHSSFPTKILSPQIGLQTDGES